MLSEEEKKAIQYLNKYCDTDLFYEQQHYNYIKMVIKLVEKQQKELEQEKEKNKELKKYYATRKEVEDLKETIACLHESAKDYISKDKIRDKVIQVKDRPVKDEFITATQGKLNTIIVLEELIGEV